MIFSQKEINRERRPDITGWHIVTASVEYPRVYLLPGRTALNKLTFTALIGMFLLSAPLMAEEVRHRYLEPANVAPALGQYSLGVETTGDLRWVHVAGQTGVRKDGSIPKDFATQATVAMENIRGILAEAGMGWEDVVSYRVYMTHREDMDAWRTLGKDLLAGAKPAGTLVFVSGLVHPDWRIEIEATAARDVSDNR
jgi:2-iminobutanoate/2-iminopropanoate deaminase